MSSATIRDHSEGTCNFCHDTPISPEDQRQCAICGSNLCLACSASDDPYLCEDCKGSIPIPSQAIKPKHTPGPWKIDGVSPLGIIEDTENGYGICEVAGFNPTVNDLANAHLMVASPDLLEACELVITESNNRLTVSGERNDLSKNAFNLLQSAIAKALPTQEVQDE